MKQLISKWRKYLTAAQADNVVLNNDHTNTKQSKINSKPLKTNIETVSAERKFTGAINTSLFRTDWYNFTIYDLYEVQVINKWARQVNVTGVVTAEVSRITVLARDDSHRNVIVDNCQWNIVMLNNHEDAVEIIGQIESRNAISEDKDDRLLLNATVLYIFYAKSKQSTRSQ